jgi:hypothetical protein
MDTLVLMFGRRRLGFLVVAAVVVAACAAPAESTPPSAPSEEPTPIATINARYTEFRARVAGAVTREGLYVRQFADASAGTNEDLSRVAAELLAWVDGEGRWWESHDADPCYADAFQAYAVGLRALAAAGEAFAEVAAGSPPDPVAGQAAAAVLADATSRMTAASTLAIAAARACQ